MLLGGLWIEEENVKIVDEKVKNLRKISGYKNNQEINVDFLGEFKWTKVSDKYLDVYKKFVDIFFECIEKDLFRFCVMLIDTKNPVIISYSNIKKEGYFKLLYQLYFHNSKIPAIYKIYPDRITNPTQDNVDFNVLNRCLDKSFSKKFSPMINPIDLPNGKGFVNNITSINSKKCDFIQLVDVVMGAIGYLQNRLFDNPEAKKAKVELMRYIFEKITLSGAIKFSGKRFYVAKSTKFNIWLFKPNNKKSHQ